MVSQVSGRTVLPILALPRLVKRVLVLLLDLSLCFLTTWLAYYLRLGEFISLYNIQSFFGRGMVLASFISVALALPIFIVLGLYRAIFRYSGWPAVMTVAQAVGIYGVIYAAIFTVSGLYGVPRTVGIIQPILLFLFVGGSRLFARVWLGDHYRSILKRSNRPKILIYGAGSSGRLLSDALVNSHEMQVVGFLDDDSRLQGQILNGLSIYSPEDLSSLVSSLNIHSVLLALPSIPRQRRNAILNQMQRFNVLVRTLPSMLDLVQGKVNTSDIRELDIDDLLGREIVTPDPILLSKNIVNKVVLVTGAGGSIGSELCRQILALKPSTLLLVELSEAALYVIHEELLNKLNQSNIVLIPLLASVQNSDRMKEIISTWKPETIYHAAAYKHVPLVEHNLVEGIQNNVFGTLTTALEAIEYGVNHFVLISTDKAVRPTNMMGASKRLAEMLLQALAKKTNETKFSMVRFGNVLGSSGSVVPKFRQQIHDGGPVTLTHPEMTRFFMTIPEAAQLVIQAGAMSDGGALFVLDMGEPVRIEDLAKRMIQLSGLKVKDQNNLEGDLEIVITGLRPGEKLYEELLIGDNAQPTDHPRIMKAHEDFLVWEELQIKLQDLVRAIENRDFRALRIVMQELVVQYTPSEEIMDWVSLNRDNKETPISSLLIK